MFYGGRIIYKQYVLFRVEDRLILAIPFSLLLVAGHKAFFDLILKYFTFVIKWLEKTTDLSWFGYYGVVVVGPCSIIIVRKKFFGKTYLLFIKDL